MYAIVCMACTQFASTLKLTVLLSLQVTTQPAVLVQLVPRACLRATHPRRVKVPPAVLHAQVRCGSLLPSKS